MASVNKVILIGNIGKDPTVTTLNSGATIVKLSLATSESWKDKNTGERKEKTEWHNVVIYNEHVGKVVEQYCKKGSKVYIEGAIQTRKYTDQGGTEKYITEIVLQNYKGAVVLLGDKPEGGGRRGDDEDERPARGGSAKPVNDLDDDIPF